MKQCVCVPVQWSGHLQTSWQLFDVCRECAPNGNGRECAYNGNGRSAVNGLCCEFASIGNGQSVVDVLPMAIAGLP
eukprot:1084638-Pelagomonas_calceolata.AAC.5